MSEELKEEIDKACALEGVEDGDTPSRSEWIRRACENELSRNEKK